VGWKIATVTLAVVLAVAIGLGAWQISSNRQRSINGEAQLAALIVQDRVAQSQSTSNLKTEIGNVLADSLGTSLGTLQGIEPSITNLQSAVSCLEQDITDIENQTSSYLVCNAP
jgi:uncharacterized protein HemX